MTETSAWEGSNWEEQDYSSLAARHVSLRRVLALFAPHKRLILLIGVLVLSGAAVGVASPFLLRTIIDDALPARDMGLLGWLSAGIVAVAAFTAAMNVVQTIVSTRVGQAVMHELRVRVYEHLQSLSLRWFAGQRTGEIQSRIASDIGGLEALVTHTGTELARNLGVVTTTTIAMLLLDWRLAIFSFVAVPPSLWLSRRVGAMREAVTHEQQSRIADMSSLVQETLSISGVILTRTLNRSRYLNDRFRRASSQVAALEVRSQTTGEWQWSLIYLLLGALPALTLLLGGWLMGLGAPVTIGTLVALIALQEQLLWPLEEVLETTIRIRTTRALFARVFEYLDAPADVTEPASPAALPIGFPRGAVQIEHVGFAYDGAPAPALVDVSIDIPAGTHVAIVGATGCGKTTLGYLLARLMDVDSGTIRYDGLDVRDLGFDQLSRMLGVVTQEPFLLNGSVAENMRFAKPEATMDEIIAAARVAQVHDLIQSLPDGYDTVVGERGYRFSGGEKQRLALARTILRQPAALLLDEATSALDAQTEKAMIDALDGLQSGRTVITIAHRLSTVRNADQIIVLQKGKVVERGTHGELLMRGGVYTGLVEAAV